MSNAKKHKKRLSAFLVFLLCISMVFAGCGEAADKDTDVSGKGNAQEEGKTPASDNKEDGASQDGDKSDQEPSEEKEPAGEVADNDDQKEVADNTGDGEEKEPAEEEVDLTAGDGFLFAGGTDEGYFPEDCQWFIDAADSDVITLVYTCTDSSKLGWGVMAWGVEADGEWIDGPSFASDWQDATAVCYSVYTVGELREALGITGSSEVGRIQLGVWNGGKILALTCDSKKAEIPAGALETQMKIEKKTELVGDKDSYKQYIDKAGKELFKGSSTADNWAQAFSVRTPVWGGPLDLGILNKNTCVVVKFMSDSEPEMELQEPWTKIPPIYVGDGVAVFNYETIVGAYPDLTAAGAFNISATNSPLTLYEVKVVAMNAEGEASVEAMADVDVASSNSATGSSGGWVDEYIVGFKNTELDLADLWDKKGVWLSASESTCGNYGTTWSGSIPAEYIGTCKEDDYVLVVSYDPKGIPVGVISDGQWDNRTSHTWQYIHFSHLAPNGYAYLTLQTVRMGMADAFDTLNSVKVGSRATPLTTYSVKLVKRGETEVDTAGLPDFPAIIAQDGVTLLEESTPATDYQTGEISNYGTLSVTQGKNLDFSKLNENSYVVVKYTSTICPNLVVEGTSKGWSPCAPLYNDGQYAVFSVNTLNFYLNGEVGNGTGMQVAANGAPTYVDEVKVVGAEDGFVVVVPAPDPSEKVIDLAATAQQTGTNLLSEPQTNGAWSPYASINGPAWGGTLDLGVALTEDTSLVVKSDCTGNIVFCVQEPWTQIEPTYTQNGVAVYTYADVVAAYPTLSDAKQICFMTSTEATISEVMFVQNVYEGGQTDPLADYIAVMTRNGSWYEYGLNLTDYNADFQKGQAVTVTVVLKSDGQPFTAQLKRTIDANYGGQYKGWTTSDSGAQVTITGTFDANPNEVDKFGIQLIGSEGGGSTEDGTRVGIVSVTVTPIREIDYAATIAQSGTVLLDTPASAESGWTTIGTISGPIAGLGENTCIVVKYESTQAPFLCMTAPSWTQIEPVYAQDGYAVFTYDAIKLANPTLPDSCQFMFQCGAALTINEVKLVDIVE